MEHSNVTLDLKVYPLTPHPSQPPSDTTQGAKYPVGRNACGFRQKFNHLKKALRPELDAIQAGNPLDGAAYTPKKATPKKAAAPKASTPRKRKSMDSDNDGADAAPKKRGRPKKVAEAEVKLEDGVKEESDFDDVV
jgi:hypothetical protein